MKEAAFGTIFNTGTRQVETAVIVGTIVDAGNATVTVTATTLVAESPVAVVVAVLSADTADTVARKFATALNLEATLTDHFIITSNGQDLILTCKLPAANNAAINIAYTNTSCTGLTPDASSNHTNAGVAYAAVAQVSNIGGPGLALDTEDVTTHDSASGWEEVVGTILRSGEVTLDLVYDPNAASHSHATDGLADRYENKKLTRCQLTFPGPYTWTFSGYVTGYEPASPSDGALTASVTLKISGAPTLV
jgi:hypothetical protein